MNVVHAVLRNWDIQRIIINFLKDHSRWHPRHRFDRDLVAVALVCRGLSDLALNVLWRHINVKKIYFLFPLDMIRVHPDGTKSLTRIPETPKEWERFDVHASRVRKLSTSRPLDVLFLLGVQKRYPILPHPFPNLTCLLWSSTPLNVIDAMAFICPTLAQVQLSIGDLGADEGEDDDALADLLRILGETCPLLRDFAYIHRCIRNIRSKAVEISLIHLIHRCRRLEDVQLPVSHDILQALARLPRLSKLQLDHATWEDGSQIPLLIEADEWIEEADRFPTLDNLNIQYSHTVSSLTECFQGSGCFPRKRFAMWQISDQWSTLAIAEFFCRILRPDRREGLSIFSIYRDSRVKNPAAHDPWQALRFLSSIPNLHKLSLNGLFLDISDTDLEEISRIWPKLHSLRLEVPCTYGDQSQISFLGLANLSTLENLETLSIMLAPESTISESMLSPSTSSNSRLKYLNIQGKFPRVAPYAAAMFLIHHFPKLRRMNTSPFRRHLDMGDAERIKEIQVLLKDLRLKRFAVGSDPEPGLTKREVKNSLEWKIWGKVMPHRKLFSTQTNA